MYNKLSGTVLIVLIVMLVIGIAPSIVGIVKSFQSHWVTGVIVTVIPSAPFVVGICEIFGYPLADKITALHQG